MIADTRADVETVYINLTLLYIPARRLQYHLGKKARHRHSKGFFATGEAPAPPPAGLSYGFSTRAGGGGGDSGLSAYADSKRLDAGAGASSS